MYCSAFVNYNFTLICFPFSHFRSPPKAGPERRFIISAWISGADMADKSEGRRSSSGEGVDFLPHCFQASSSSSSTTSSRSSVMWTLRFEASATRTNWGNDESGPGMPLHHLGLDLRRRHGRQIGGTEIELRRGRRFLAPLLLGVVLLVVDDVVKIIHDVDPSV
jgi:hypothetical protein